MGKKTEEGETWPGFRPRKNMWFLSYLQDMWLRCTDCSWIRTEVNKTLSVHHTHSLPPNNRISICCHALYHTTTIYKVRELYLSQSLHSICLWHGLAQEHFSVGTFYYWILTEKIKCTLLGILSTRDTEKWVWQTPRHIERKLSEEPKTIKVMKRQKLWGGEYRWICKWCE